MLALLISASGITGTHFILTTRVKAEPSTIDVKITPDSVKLSAGQHQLFVADIRNGTSPFTVNWYFNDTYLSSGIDIDFYFVNACSYIALRASVVDSLENFGSNTVLIYASYPITAKEAESKVLEYSYLIFGNGSTYYAKNSLTGAISASNTDASAVIQNALDSLTDNRTWMETIILKGDLGNVHDIQVPSCTAIVGEDTELTLPPDQMMVFKNSGTAVSNVTIKNINFVSISTNRSIEPIAIDLGKVGGVQATNIKIENSGFHNFIHGSGTPSGIRGNYRNLQVFGNHFYSQSGTGNSYQIYLSGGGDGIQIFNNTFINNHAGNAIYTYRVSNLKIWGNHFEQTANWATEPVEAIDLEGVSRVNIYNNTFFKVSIDGVLIGQNGGAGNVKDVNIQSNNFIYCGYQSIAKRAGVSVAGAASNNLTSIQVARNIFNSSNFGVMIGGYGFTANSINASIAANKFVNCTSPIYFYTVSTKILDIKNNSTENSDETATTIKSQQPLTASCLKPEAP